MKFLQEGPLAELLSLFMDLILLNMLWFLCSLPVFTLGASTCAVYTVTLRQALHEDPPIFKTFFCAFRKNFKKGTALFLLFAAAGLFIVTDLWAAVHWNISIRFLFIVVVLAVGYFYLAVVSHVFPVLAYFDTGIKETIRRAFFLSMRNGVFTVFIMVMNLLPFLLILTMPQRFGQILFFYFILGFAAISLLNSFHLIRLFDPEKAAEAEKRREE